MWRLRLSPTKVLAIGRRLSRLVGGDGARVSTARLTLVSASVGVLAGTGYSVYTHYRINSKMQLVPAETLEYAFLPQAPPYKPHYRVESAGGTGRDLEIVLFQYGTCPFCCKVRAYLDARGIAYDLVEVDAVLRQAISWSQYKKVPTVLAKVDGGYQQLFDSTAIISIIESHIRDGGAGGPSGLQKLLHCYPAKVFTRDDGSKATDIVNKYFLMHQDTNAPIDNKAEGEERKWRKWADDTLVHVLSPNVYRTLDEAYTTFSWFAESAQWRVHFPAWEVALMVNVGAVAMWLISKRLKTRHCLKDDVRESLYDAGRTWCAAVRGTAPERGFHGGAEPDLADLAVYGVLSSIEGCGAFEDLRAHTSIGSWYDAVRAHVDSTRGQVVLASPASAVA